MTTGRQTSFTFDIHLPLTAPVLVAHQSWGWGQAAGSFPSTLVEASITLQKIAVGGAKPSRAG